LNEFDAWNKIMLEWREVNRMKQLNQELYDLLGGALLFTISYTKKHNIPLPDMDTMTHRVHEIIEEINPPTKNQQPKATPDDSTKQIHLI
jgi:hypothetical protein